MSSSITVNTLNPYYQGQYTAALSSFPTNYPDDVPTWAAKNITPSANGNTYGILLPGTYCNKEVGVRLACTGDDAMPSAGVAVYGAVEDYVAANGQTKVTLDSSTALLEPWTHIHNLNGGALITNTTNACAGVNVIQTGTYSWDYFEGGITVGGSFKRLLIVPVALSGATTNTLNCWLYYAGGR